MTHPAAQDLQARWLPDPHVVKAAAAMLTALPGDRTVAVIPMCQPGKDHGIWTVGQEVETVYGAIFYGHTGYDADQPARVPGYHAACDMADLAAFRQLGDRPGTTAHAVVRRDGDVAVFEGLPHRTHCSHCNAPVRAGTCTSPDCAMSRKEV